jgi:hypothetical protein
LNSFIAKARRRNEPLPNRLVWRLFGCREWYGTKRVVLLTNHHEKSLASCAGTGVSPRAYRRLHTGEWNYHVRIQPGEGMESGNAVTFAP